MSDQVEGRTSLIRRETALLASLSSGVRMGIAQRQRGSQHANESEEPGDGVGDGESQQPQVHSCSHRRGEGGHQGLDRHRTELIASVSDFRLLDSAVAMPRRRPLTP